MFRKKYYRLDEVAKELCIDVETIFHIESSAGIDLHFVPKREFNAYYFEEYSDYEIWSFLVNYVRSMIEESFLNRNSIDVYLISLINENLYFDEHLNSKLSEIINKTNFIDGVYLDEINDNSDICFLIKCFKDIDFFGRNKVYIKLDYNGYYKIVPSIYPMLMDKGRVELTSLIYDEKEVFIDEKEKSVSVENLVILCDELERLRSFKNNYLTFEQLLAENKELKHQLQKLDNSDNSRQQQREMALRYWLAGKGSDTVRRMKQTDIHEELKPVNGLFQIAESTFNDFWQAQNIIKLDAGKR